MLYPDLAELLRLRHKATRLKSFAKKVTKSHRSGDYSSPFRGQGMQFDSVRRYVWGDDVRAIDWRITAKMDYPYVKIFQDDRERSIVLCVDMCKSMFFGTRGTFKSMQASFLAAIIGWYGNINNDRVGSCIFSDHLNIQHFFAPVRMKSSLFSMLDILSNPLEYQKRYCNQLQKNEDKSLIHNASKPNLVSDKTINLVSAIDLINRFRVRGALIFIISDFLDIRDELLHKLHYLDKKSDIILFVINDPADEHLPPIGDIFCDGNSLGKKFIINTEDSNISKNYHDHYITSKNKLDEMVKKLNINVINFSTERDVYNDLVYGLKSVFSRKC